MTMLVPYDKCHYCRCPMDGHDPQRRATKDHVIPKSRDGTNDPSNLVPCCDLCNRMKGNMTGDEFREYVRRGRPNKAAYLREIGL